MLFRAILTAFTYNYGRLLNSLPIGNNMRRAVECIFFDGHITYKLFDA